MLVYRINLEVGYRTVELEFQSIEEAGEFAKSFLTHIKSIDDNKKTTLSLDIINTDLEFEYADTDSIEDSEDE